MTVRLRYKQPDATEAIELELEAMDDELEFDQADTDFQFAASVVSFGMQLRQSRFVGDWDYSDVISVAQSNLDEDEFHRISSLRRAFAEVSPVDAMDDLVKRLRKTQNNAEFLLSVKDVD
mgnify:CR=1 FL=1